MGEISTPIVFSFFIYLFVPFIFGALAKEIKFSRILSFKKIIITAGLLQISISVILISLLSSLFRFNLLQSFLIGIALSSSSTTLVAKIIQDRGEDASFIGEIAIGMLLFQDIAFIPFLIIFTSINASNVSPLTVSLEIIVSFSKSVLIIGGLFYLGLKIIPWTFNKIARS